MFCDKASDWEEFELNEYDNFTRNFVKNFNPTFLVIIQFISLTNVITIKSKKILQNLQHKWKNRSYATIISSIISFILYAVKEVIVLWCKNFISTSICRICLIICTSVASGKMPVRYKGIIPFLLFSARPVFSDDSIVSTVSFLQPSVKLVCSYAIHTSRNSIVNLYLLCVFVQYLCTCVPYLNITFKVLFIQRHTHSIQLLSSYPVLLSYCLLKLPESVVLSMMFLQFLNAFMWHCFLIENIPKQPNTNQQNDKVDGQDPIKDQKQLNDHLQNATVHSQASNDEHKHRQTLEYKYITRKKLKMQTRKLKQAKYFVEKAKAESEMKKNEEIKQLLKKIHELEFELEHEKKNSQMSNDKIMQMVELINELKQKYDEKMKEKRSLFIRIKQLKATECNQNCVIDVILRICQTKVPGVNFQLYRRPLEKIIIKEAADKIEKNDLKCDQLMEILKKNKVVTRVAQYKYLSEEDKLQVIDEAWDRLMSIDSNKRVLILGRVISYANKKGHAELCDLDTRHDEEVKIYNPATDKEEWTNQEDFRDLLCSRRRRS